MQRQIEDMDLELEQYHKSNLALNLMIGKYFLIIIIITILLYYYNYYISNLL